VLVLLTRHDCSPNQSGSFCCAGSISRLEMMGRQFNALHLAWLPLHRRNQPGPGGCQKRKRRQITSAQKNSNAAGWHCAKFLSLFMTGLFPAGVHQSVESSAVGAGCKRHWPRCSRVGLNRYSVYGRNPAQDPFDQCNFMWISFSPPCVRRRV